MDADWYVDPLGRYDGRFFDGTMWTARVSADGVPAVDADWPPTEAPAVQPMARRAPVRASMLVESPVRIVAVLDGPGRPNTPRHRPRLDRGRRALLAAVGVIVIIAVLMLLLNRGGDVPSDAGAVDQVGSDQAQSGSVDVADVDDLDDLEAIEVGDVAGESTDGAADRGSRGGLVDPDPPYGPKDVIEVGALRVVNGVAVLRELARWHREQAIDRGIEPIVDSWCWFGRLAGAAVQTVACGPTAGGAGGEFRYDLVPVRFVDDARGHLAHPVIEAVTFDAVLANGLELVGGPDGPEPPG